MNSLLAYLSPCIDRQVSLKTPDIPNIALQVEDAAESGQPFAYAGVFDGHGELSDKVCYSVIETWNLPAIVYSIIQGEQQHLSGWKPGFLTFWVSTGQMGRIHRQTSLKHFFRWSIMHEDTLATALTPYSVQSMLQSQCGDLVKTHPYLCPIDRLTRLC